MISDNMSKISFLLLFVFAFSSSCRSRKESNNQIESNTIYLSVSKTGCFGNCPIYTHTINGKNWSLIGDRFFKYIGEFNTSNYCINRYNRSMGERWSCTAAAAGSIPYSSLSTWKLNGTFKHMNAIEALSSRIKRTNTSMLKNY